MGTLRQRRKLLPVLCGRLSQGNLDQDYHREDEEIGRVQNTDWYFRQGLTWPRRTQRGFSVRRLPAACIFADKGPGIFAKSQAREACLLGVLNSSLAEFILRSLISFGSWEVGAVKKVPVPEPSSTTEKEIGALAQSSQHVKATWDTGNEVCSAFERPWLLQPVVRGGATTLAPAVDAVLSREAA